MKGFEMDDRDTRKKRATAMAYRAVDPWLSLRQATDYLGFKDPQTTTDLVERGRLEGEKVNRIWKFRMSALERFRDSCRYLTKKEREEKASGLLAGVGRLGEASVAQG